MIFYEWSEEMSVGIYMHDREVAGRAGQFAPVSPP